MARKTRKFGQHGRRNAAAAAPPLRGTNMFETLSTPSFGESAGEMNTQISERLRVSHPPDHEVSNTQFGLTPVPIASNKDIQDYFNSPHLVSTESAWLSKPEIPAPDEIRSSQPPWTSSEKIVDLDEVLRPNKAQGAYDSNEEYLETQYSLLREDAIRPLRQDVERVRQSPYLDEAEYEGGSIGIYEPVYLTSIVFSGRGLATRVAFSLGRVKKHVRWDQSKRLITGSLVALSPAEDCFQSKCILATVAARPLAALDQNPPEIDLYFARAEDMEIDPMKKWIMVESRSSFYEASRHTLLALQHMMREPFPLSEHLVKVQRQVEPPKYVLKNPYTDMSSLVSMEETETFRNVNILEQWPSTKSHGLDTSQSQALKRILSNRLAIVQGPPGTGKTYVSVVALKILLAQMTSSDPPIIVTCQTNHALDQLLRHIAEFETNFIRLGGRSKDKDVIKKRTLFEVRQGNSQPRSHGNSKTRAIVMMKKLINDMQMLLAPLEANKPPLDHRVLVKLGLITPEQADSLEMDSQYAMGISPDTPGIQMEQWLGKCLTPCIRPLQPEDFGMEFEEEDFEIEQLQELEAEAVAQDDDFETLKGPVTLLNDNVTGKSGATLRSDSEIRALLDKTQDLTSIPPANRGAIYNYFQRHTKRLIAIEFRNLAKTYQKLVLQRQIGQWEQDLVILSSQRIIGMTTTGLSKYRALIAALKPKIVLVEEAAETMEAPVTSACLPSLEHLILVGDHQQLRPHCQLREFEDEPYNFNLSLFERMVNNEVEIDCLTRQRRMIPEIRRLLQPIYGNTLKDHANVKDVSNRPPVEGMGGTNSYFFTHEWLEDRDANMSSLNRKEAQMVVGFFDYLVLNGIDPCKITVLTFYNGQRKAIIKGLRQHPNLRGLPALNVVTVDSYQGEENDVVLLSLVRSNRKHNIGFLSVDNRICVALSRAKRGFYIFGNAEMLAIESDTWAEVVSLMYGKKIKNRPETGQQRRIGYHLPLECSKHQYKVWVEDPADWDILNGGCDQSCRCTLPCGHMCTLRCHPFENSLINCTQKCNKRIDPCGHPCTALCCDPCKCQFCDRYNDGTRALLKASRGPQNPKAYQPQGMRHDQLVDVAPQDALPDSLGCPGARTERSGSDLLQWNQYANGGATEDDAEYARKVMEKNESASGEPVLRLIEVSPVKRQTAPSKNVSMLVELDNPVPQPKPRFNYRETLTYGPKPQGENKQQARYDLLD